MRVRSYEANARGALWISCAALLGLSACTSLDTLTKGGIEEALQGTIVIPMDAGTDADADVEDAGEDAGDADAGQTFESDELCMYPPTPPREIAASIDEAPCSESSESWPDCNPNECDGDRFPVACRQLCEMNCERRTWFCDREFCEADYCGSAAALAECQGLCDGDTACLNQLCEDTYTSECNDFVCPDEANNACGGQTCDNTCDTAFNGKCEDGSAINSLGDSCAIGTDCADCGAREDQCFDLGAECRGTVQCCGFESFDAWCVPVANEDGLGALGRCVSDCTTTDTCDEGFTCRGLVGGNDACFPFCALSQ